jgi:hypothetical protein
LRRRNGISPSDFITTTFGPPPGPRVARSYSPWRSNLNPATGRGHDGMRVLGQPEAVVAANVRKAREVARSHSDVRERCDRDRALPAAATLLEGLVCGTSGAASCADDGDTGSVGARQAVFRDDELPARINRRRVDGTCT